LPKHLPEGGIDEDGGVLLKADDAPVPDMIDVHIREREHHVVEERVRDDRQHDGDRRAEQHGEEDADDDETASS
jgi:hypothetical protein